MLRPSPQGGKWLWCSLEGCDRIHADPGDAPVILGRGRSFQILNRGQMLAKETANGSEGDAYRYTKKVLLSLPNRESLRRIYEEIAQNRGISSWTRAAYQDVRAHFFRDGQCKIRFAPGAARIAFGELSLGTGDEEPGPIGRLHDIIRIISIAHSGEYDRYLGRDGLRPSFKELDEIYGQRIAKHWSAMKRMLRRRHYGQRRYRIIPLDDFETAKEYARYTEPHVWCHLNSKSMFDHYRMANTGGKALPVKLYLAVLPGFEELTETDEMYGESMLGIDIGPCGRLVHVNNRWNHSHDYVDQRKGDNKYDEVELSDLLGGPFFEICPPYGHDTYHELAIKMREERLDINAKVLARRKEISKSIHRGRNRVRRSGTFTDPRDGNVYRTETIGGRTWMVDPLRFIPEKIVELPRNPGKLLNNGTPTFNVFLPRLVVEPASDGNGLTCAVNWQCPADEETFNLIIQDCNSRLGDVSDLSVRQDSPNTYVVSTTTRDYVSIDGQIDVYDRVINVFLDRVMIGDTPIEGSLLDDMTKFLDTGDGTDYQEQLRADREKAVAEALEKAGLPHDAGSVTVVTATLVEEYSKGGGVAEYRLNDQVSNSFTCGRKSWIVLRHSSIPHSHNYVSGGKARELVTFRYNPDGLTPEAEAVIRAIEPGITVNVTAKDGARGVLYSPLDAEKVIPEGWRLPTIDDLYRMYAALGAKVTNNPDAHSKLCANPYLNGKAFTMCGIRVPRELRSDTDSYPSLYIETDQGRYDIIQDSDGGDDEVITVGKNASEILCGMVGFSSLARLTLGEFGFARYTFLGRITSLVSQEVGVVDAIDFDGTTVKRVHMLRSASVRLGGDRLILGTESGRYEERVPNEEMTYIGEGIRREFTQYERGYRRFLFLVRK